MPSGILCWARHIGHVRTPDFHADKLCCCTSHTCKRHGLQMRWAQGSSRTALSSMSSRHTGHSVSLGSSAVDIQPLEWFPPAADGRGPLLSATVHEEDRTTPTGVQEKGGDANANGGSLHRVSGHVPRRPRPTPNPTLSKTSITEGERGGCLATSCWPISVAHAERAIDTACLAHACMRR